MGHIWRIPAVLGVMAGSALLLVAAAVTWLTIARGRHSAGARRGMGAVVVLLAVCSAIAVRVAATLVARSLEIDVTDVDPGVVGYVAPTMFAAFALAVGDRTLKRAWTSRRALLFYLWLFVFTAANVVNRCAPGWCASIGFPFPWQSWSDSIMTFGDGRIVNAIATIGAIVCAVLDLLTFAAVARALGRIRIPGRPA